jgi:integrase/recombinase XerD
MKLSTAVDIYVLRRHAMGQKFEGPAATLRAFSRRYSNNPLKGIVPADVKQFLDVPQTGPAAWRRKYGVLRDFFTYWRYAES